MISKYRAVKTTIDGVTFASKKEAARYVELKLCEKYGVISNLELQPKYVLIGKFTTRSGEKIRELAYVADFRYVDSTTGDTIVEDVKGMKTDVYKIKRKLLLWRYPDIDFREL